MSLQLISISPLSHEFGQIEYELQLQLKSPHVQITDCFDLSNSHVSSRFSSYVKHQSRPNIVHVFVPASSLQQSVADIVSQGIRVDRKRGFRFRVGSFEFDNSEETVDVVRLAVSLGRTLNFQPLNSNLLDGLFTSDVPTSSNLRDDYESLCVSAAGDYVIFQSQQVKACQLVRFQTSSFETDNICEMCGERPAVVWCVNDSAKLCKECDTESHSQNKMFQRHKRIPLEDAMGPTDLCPIHGTSKLEYFCTKCRTPLCVSCKVLGSHSKGDAASHPLVPIKEAYENAIEASSRVDQVVTDHVKRLEEQRKTVIRKLEGIVANEKDVEEEVMRIANSVIEKARLLAGERALLLRSMRTELDRKMEEVNGILDILQQHKSDSGEVGFVKAYGRYRNLVEELEDVDGEVEVEGDLFLHGSLDVSYNAITASTKRKVDEETTEEPVTPKKKRQSPTPKPKTKTPSPEKRRSSQFPVEYALLTDIADRKKAKMKNQELKFQPFQGSQILPTSKASTLYLCLPFRAQPQTHLLFSTERDGRSITRMHELIDGVGITSILVKAGSYVFGGFAAAKWMNNGRPFGENSSSFLFSITHNAFIPYRPRVSDACHLYATEDSLTFGRYDLNLSDDFDECSAVIENSYGIGLEPGGNDASRFLAGVATFSADIVEVWGFFTVNA